MMEKATHDVECELRAEENETYGKYITGLPIVFEERTDLGPWDEIISEGALDKTDLRDVRLLVNHNINMIPLARSRNNNANSTMQLDVVPGRGLSIRANLDTENNTEAKSLYSAVERGDITGMSFMFMVDKDRWEDVDTDHPTRRIDSISRVFEVSAVTNPAYAQTVITARGISDALESGKESLESAKAAKRKLELAKAKLKARMHMEKSKWN